MGERFSRDGVFCVTTNCFYFVSTDCVCSNGFCIREINFIGNRLLSVRSVVLVKGFALVVESCSSFCGSFNLGRVPSIVEGEFHLCVLTELSSY